MSAEKIIKQINKDAQKEVKQIINEAEKQYSQIINDSKKEALNKSELMISNGIKHSEVIKKILISKANQEAKREITKTKEIIIEECFKKADNKISEINDEKYKTIVTKLMKEGRKKLGGKCKILISKNIDRKIAEKLDIEVTGKIKSTGGIVLKSIDGKIILDNTFNGILKREKDKIRIKVGRLLFT
jgi:V/A-type H+-transporting ATPase subunit E